MIMKINDDWKFTEISCFSILSNCYFNLLLNLLCVQPQRDILQDLNGSSLLLTGPFSPVGITWCVSLMTEKMCGTLPPTWSMWSHTISSSTLVILMLRLVSQSARMMTRRGLTSPKYQVTNTNMYSDEDFFLLCDTVQMMFHLIYDDREFLGHVTRIE